LIAGLLFSVLVASLAPAQAGPISLSPAASAWDGPGLRLFRSWAEQPGLGFLDDLLPRLLDRDARKVETSDYAYPVVIGDISGDGRPDQVVLLYRFTLGDQGQDEIRASITAREGDTGRVLWRKVVPKDTLIVPFDARVGPRHEGLVLVEVTGFALGTTEQRYVFRAMNDRGRQVWKHEIVSTIVGEWPFAFTATNYPVTADVFQAVPGRATDVLLAWGTVTFPPMWELRSGVIEAGVLDGRDGALASHPAPVAGVGIIPFAAAMDDLDGDRFDDYVFITRRANLPLGGEGEPPVSGPHDGIVDARRGSDGLLLWTGEGLDYQDQNLNTSNLGDITGDGIGDVFVETSSIYLGESGANGYATYLLNGAQGDLMWKRPGQWPYSPGDIDRDGYRDLLVQSYYSGEGFLATKVWAREMSGALIWKKEYRTENVLHSCCSLLIHFDDESWGVGDVDGDRHHLEDGFIYHHPPRNAGEADAFVIDAKGGARIASGGSGFNPLGISVDRSSADIAYLEWLAPGDLEVVVKDARDRAIVRSRVGFDLPISPRDYLYAEGAHIDGDECGDVVVLVMSDLKTYEIVLDGATGGIMWSDSIGSRAGSARLIEKGAPNPAC